MYKAARNLSVLGIGLSISAIVGWLLLREKKREKDMSSVIARPEGHATEPNEMSQIVLPLETLEHDEEVDAPRTEIEDRPISQDAITQVTDDLTRISGIGPRFAEALQAIGISRFGQLVDQTPEELSQRLAPFVRVSAQRIRDHDWIGQAAQLSK